MPLEATTPEIKIAPQYPPPNTPTFFADGVMNFNHSPEVAKFYWFRFDPAIGLGPNQTQIVAQTAIPLSGFVQTVAFFQAAIHKLIGQGSLDAQVWDNAVKEADKGFGFNG